MDLPEDLQATSPHRNYADDRVLPRAEDGNGFGAGKKPPGGFVCRMDPDGKNAELYASGERNTYDIAFNADGELFGFDSDMEWDWGTPWYRPIRVFHAVSGADQGFREGTAKWPEYYADSMPAVVNIGIGCPTGVGFGYGAKFPAKYQKAFYILDWTYGRLIAVHIKPKGASYDGDVGELRRPQVAQEQRQQGAAQPDRRRHRRRRRDVLHRRRPQHAGEPLPRHLHRQRVHRQGRRSTTPTAPTPASSATSWRPSTATPTRRPSRRRGRTSAARTGPSATPPGWRSRASRSSQWQSKALSETKPQAALTALLALARLGGTQAQPEVLKALAKLPMSSLPEAQQLDKLRVLEVSISRQGKPAGDLAKQVIAELDPLYPAKSEPLNRELSQVLLALEAPDATAKTVKLLEAAPTQEEQLNYVLFLRTIKTGWTPELRRQYFSWWTKDHNNAAHPEFVTRWFQEAGIRFNNGASFNNFVKHLHEDAEKSLTPDEAKSLADVLAAYVAAAGRRAARPPRPARS